MLTVSILVHDDFSHIGAALESLAATTQTPHMVMVTINAGNSDNIAAFKQEHPEVQIIVNESPRGFAANHNHVMRLAETEFVALLNDDIKLHDGALDTLVSYLQQHPKIGLVGPYLQNSDGTKQVSVYSDPSMLRVLYKISGMATLTSQQSPIRRLLLGLGIGRILHVESLKMDDQAPRSVPVIKGTVMVVRRQTYEQVGLIDETTLGYGEEIDWDLRIRQAGWDVVYVPHAKVTHFGQGQVSLRLHGVMLVEDRKAILNYFLKHRPRWQAIVVRLGIIISHGLWSVIWLLFNRSKTRAHWNVMRMAISFKRVGAVSVSP